jgi:hypothetical protein
VFDGGLGDDWPPQPQPEEVLLQRLLFAIAPLGLLSTACVTEVGPPTWYDEPTSVSAPSQTAPLEVRDARFWGSIVDVESFEVDAPTIDAWTSPEGDSLMLDGEGPGWSTMVVLDTYGIGLDELEPGRTYALDGTGPVYGMACSGPDSWEDEASGENLFVSAIDRGPDATVVAYTLSLSSMKWGSVERQSVVIEAVLAP